MAFHTAWNRLPDTSHASGTPSVGKPSRMARLTGFVRARSMKRSTSIAELLRGRLGGRWHPAQHRRARGAGFIEPAPRGETRAGVEARLVAALCRHREV